ncbi:MAG: DNA polymerase III subunit chi [Cellvibrionaceae bacterium]
MTQVDFYILQQDNPIARLHFACRLSEKAANRNHHIVIAVQDEAQAKTLSEYLWSFKPESFLPHHLQTEEAPSSSIMLAWDKDEDQYHDILINLRDDIPEWFSRFQRVMEIVVQEDSCLSQTRDHFQFYRDRGYPLKSHPV